MQASLFLRRRLVHSSASPILTPSFLARRTQVLYPSRRSLTRCSPLTRPFSTFPSSTAEPKRASSSFWAITFTLLLIGGGTWFQNQYLNSAKDSQQRPSSPEDPQLPQQQQEPFLGVVDLLQMMPVESPPGTVGNLTREQEAKLQELWTLTLNVFGVKVEETGDKNSGLASLNVLDGDDKHGQSKEFQQALADIPPEDIRRTFWNMVKHDNPDSLLLRFLRARKWDVKKALVMFISTLNWRAREIKVDGDVMKNGEGLALKQSQSSDPAEKKAGEEFLNQMRLGKSYLHGVDKAGRPICVVRVRLHKAADQSQEVVERYTVYLIESTRMVLAPPVETATIVFDMSGFSLANMDYAPVKFMIKCFEANYPESLGTVLVHKAPWLFSGIWSIIKGWLDPVVAGKVHFTKNANDLEKFIPRSRLPKELEGDENWEYQYVEPQLDENKLMEDTAKRDELIAERQGLAKEIQDATISWLLASSRKDKEAISLAEERRNDLINQLRHHYWVLDPYVRARSLYDRVNVIQGGGKIQFYPEA